MVVVQNSINDPLVDKKNLKHILQQVLVRLKVGKSELLIRLVDKPEIQNLNKTYRHQDKPTNVLAFPSDLPIEIDEAILGDVVICPLVVKQEANAQGKTFNNHLLHMAIHGILHLLGYVHIDEKDAQKMQALEAKILSKIGVGNPWH